MTKKTILIVEDDLSIVRALEKKITQAGFIFLKAHDGQEGLKLALAKHPDLILLDIVMPVMDGIAMLKKLRTDNWGKTARVIILTNLSEAESDYKKAGHKFDGFLVKSNWKIADLVEKIQKKI